MTLASITQGQGRPLVLLHGWGMNAGVWLPLLPRLEAHWRVTMIELPGHGESHLIEGDIHDWAGAVLDTAPSNAIWLGWSLGAMVTLAAAAAAPERFEALVLAGGTPRFVREPGWECGMQPELLNNFAHELFDSPQRTMMRFLGLQVRGADNERETLKTLRSAVERRPVPASQALRTGLDILLHADLRVQLAEMEMPMLWLYGERDTLVSAATAAEIDRMSTVAETSVIAGAGHAPFLSHPQQCLNAMGGYA